MLDIRLIREQADMVRQGLSRRGFAAEKVDALVREDAAHRKAIAELEALRTRINTLSEKGVSDKKARMEAREAKGRLRKLEEKERTAREVVGRLLNGLPNIPLPQTPDGKDEEDNVVVREGVKPKEFAFLPKDHATLSEAHDLVDTARAARVSGTRFVYLKREAALLEFALICYALDMLVAEGFVPVVPPAMIRPEVFRGMGRLAADQEEERYFLQRDELYLIGSAEHALGPLHMSEILPFEQLPVRYVGFSSCFRREAGSYGKDTKGILRLHEFDKVEMFVFTSPETSGEELEYLVSLQERIVQGLGLPYRVVAISSGDIGWTDAQQYDIEVWFPGERRFRETHSASNTTDFQARGVNVRFKRTQSAKPEYVHMLNATGLAVGRTIAAILENYQQKDGTIVVPDALRSYCAFDQIPKKNAES